MEEDTGSTKGFRQLAADIRAKAETITNTETKQMMQDLAADYDQVAKSLEVMARSTKGRHSH